MKLVLAEPRYLKESVSIISELVNEVTFKVDETKIEIVAMDPANVAMIIFKLLSSAFVEYDVKKPVSLCVSLDSLKQVLRRAKPSDTLKIELDESKNRLKIQLKGESTRTFNLSLIDIEETEQRIPELNFGVRVEMPTMLFDEAIEDMSVIAESVALIANRNNFTIKSESKLSNAKVEISKDDDTTIRAQDEDIMAKYSIEYLRKISKAGKLSDKVILNFDKEYPLKAEFRVLDKLDLSFILAPRVSSD
ncbi:MAG: proliferating cell nuclear antigen (pcna) [Candidatus Nanoarchaeia archaeon]|nr:proliferating cell nuclear antigen (pcna) [Candidatus Nanoarchaeia archaeon]